MDKPSLNGFKRFAYSGGAPKNDPEPLIKPWQGRQEDVIKMWQYLQPGPLNIEPVPTSHKGPRFSADGIRITGRGEFINSVLARLKDLIPYQTAPGTELDVEYRELAGRSNRIGAAKRQPRYVAYIHVLEKPLKPLKTNKKKE